MANEEDANKQNGNGENASGSSPENKTPSNENPNPAAEPTKTERIPFDRDPQVQDYIGRQLESRWQQFLALQGMSQQKREDASGELERELIDEGVDGKVAKKLISVFNRMTDNKLKTTIEPLQKDMQRISINDRLAIFASEHPDFEQYRKTMLEIYKNLSQSEQNFIENSPNGMDFLYSKAKVLVPQNQNGNRSGTNSIPNRSGTKLEQGNVWGNKAAEALSKGDRKGYAEAIANMNSGR